MNKYNTCPIVRDLLPMHIDGLTAPETAAFVERHLADCDACRAARRDMLSAVLPEEQARAEFLDALRRARIRRRRRNLLILAVFLALAAVCLLPLPRSVNLCAPALRWRAGVESEPTRTVQVVMRGVYLDFLLFDDRYFGDIAIEGIPVTQPSGAMLSLKFDESGFLVFRDADNHLSPVGFIVASPGMKQFAIGLHEDGGWSGSSGLMLTHPAVDRSSAVGSTREVIASAGCSWLAEAAWECGLPK